MRGNSAMIFTMYPSGSAGTRDRSPSCSTFRPSLSSRWRDGKHQYGYKIQEFRNSASPDRPADEILCLHTDPGSCPPSGIVRPEALVQFLFGQHGEERKGISGYRHYPGAGVQPHALSRPACDGEEL